MKRKDRPLRLFFVIRGSNSYRPLRHRECLPSWLTIIMKYIVIPKMERLGSALPCHITRILQQHTVLMISYRIQSRITSISTTFKP